MGGYGAGMAPDSSTPVLRSFVYDCADPPALAAFYGRLLGGRVDDRDPHWCEVHVSGLPVKLAFQWVEHYVAPQWPDGQPQQAHLDLTVDDIPSASARAVAQGARVLGQPVAEEGGSFLVHLDPEGHPFCLCDSP